MTQTPADDPEIAQELAKLDDTVLSGHLVSGYAYKRAALRIEQLKRERDEAIGSGKILASVRLQLIERVNAAEAKLAALREPSDLVLESMGRAASANAGFAWEHCSQSIWISDARAALSAAVALVDQKKG